MHNDSRVLCQIEQGSAGWICKRCGKVTGRVSPITCVDWWEWAAGTPIHEHVTCGNCGQVYVVETIINRDHTDIWMAATDLIKKSNQLYVKNRRN